MSHVLVTETCWIWQSVLTDSGHGRFSIGGRYYMAHRVAYEDARGPIPADLTLDHFRLNPGPRQAPCSRACINPEHVEPATMRENILRGATLAAKQAATTHCPRGHAYDEANTAPQHNGHGRRCRECHRIGRRAWKRKARAKKRAGRAADGGLNG